MVYDVKYVKTKRAFQGSFYIVQKLMIQKAGIKRREIKIEKKKMSVKVKDNSD